MDLKRLSSKAKELIERRGGTGALKEDADELKRVAQGEGSLTDKARAAADALKEPGAEEPAAAQESPAAEASPAERERAVGKVEGEARGKHGAGGRGRGRGQGKRRGGGGRGGGGGRDRL